MPKFSTIDPVQIPMQLKALLDQNRQQITKILSTTQPFTWESLLQPLEELDENLHHFWSPINHLNSVANSPAIREAYNASLPLLSDYQTEIGHNQALYQAITQVAEGPDYPQLNSAQKMVLKHILRDFKLAGVALNENEKKHFAELNKELSQLTTLFEEHVLDATQGWSKHITDAGLLSGLPEIAIQAAEQAAKQKQLSGWLFTLEAPSYMAVMLNADSSLLRQEMYTAFVTRASDQGPQAGQWDNSQVMLRHSAASFRKSQITWL